MEHDSMITWTLDYSGESVFQDTIMFLDPSGALLGHNKLIPG